MHKRDCTRLSGGVADDAKPGEGRRRRTNLFYAKQVLLLAYLAWSFYTLYKLMNPTINVKTEAEADELRDACRDASGLLSYLDDYVKPGATTAEIDGLASRWASERGLVSAPLNYGGFGLTFDSLGKVRKRSRARSERLRAEEGRHTARLPHLRAGASPAADPHTSCSTCVASPTPWPTPSSPRSPF